MCPCSSQLPAAYTALRLRVLPFNQGFPTLHVGCGDHLSSDGSRNDLLTKVAVTPIIITAKRKLSASCGLISNAACRQDIGEV